VPCTTGQDIADAALASAALPGVLPPLAVRGKYYVDGSVRDVVLFKGAVDFGDSDMIYVSFARRALQRSKKVLTRKPAEPRKPTGKRAI
jgi:predicted acylesterase/phospholipase RssA